MDAAERVKALIDGEVIQFYNMTIDEFPKMSTKVSSVTQFMWKDGHLMTRCEISELVASQRRWNDAALSDYKLLLEHETDTWKVVREYTMTFDEAVQAMFDGKVVEMEGDERGYIFRHGRFVFADNGFDVSIHANLERFRKRKWRIGQKPRIG